MADADYCYCLNSSCLIKFVEITIPFIRWSIGDSDNHLLGLAMHSCGQ